MHTAEMRGKNGITLKDNILDKFPINYYINMWPNKINFNHA